MPADPELVAALEAALEGRPDNVAIRLHLAAVLSEAGEHRRALDHAVQVLERDPANVQALRIAAWSAEGIGEDGRALGYRRLVEALGTSVRPPDPPLTPIQATGARDEREFASIVRDLFGEDVGNAPATRDAPRSEWEVEQPTVTLADVAGMEDVKRRLDLTFLAPMRNPEMSRAYGMPLRGGLLLYGPPGCGKTFLARATAGELGSRFLGVGLSDVLDMWLGQSEQRLHEIFEEARRNAPCVLFFDEIDALGQRRSNLRNSPAMRAVVNQLLAEMDGAADSNTGVFVLAATNHPWDVDTALRRPGRLDRLMLVLPPDEPAREAIVRTHLRGRPAEGVDARWVARQTGEFSGADLAHLCDSAVEVAMEDSLRTGAVRPVNTDDFKRALKEVRPSTRPWFEVARNVALFANEGGTYDNLVAYLRAHRM